MIRRRVLALLAAAMTPGAQVFAGSPAVNSHHGLAIDGFDPVAYFTRGKATRGSNAHSVMWRGAVWYFASAENRELFESNPHVYAPKYGGYCAYSVALGGTSDADPTAWAIYSGRLYLVRDSQIRAIWKQDIAANIDRADANWPAVLSR